MACALKQHSGASKLGSAVLCPAVCCAQCLATGLCCAAMHRAMLWYARYALLSRCDMSFTIVSAECLVNSVSASLLLESCGIFGLSISCPCQVAQNKPAWRAQTCSTLTSPSALKLLLLLLQVGKADSTAMTNGRAALALLSRWMMTHQGSMWHRKSTSAADAYAAGKLRLTWLDASKC